MKEQENDNTYKRIMDLLRDPTLKKTDTERHRTKSFALGEGILYKVRTCRGRTSKYLAVPKTMRVLVLSECHDSFVGGCHSGFRGTISKVSERFYFPFLKSYVENYVQGCTVCQKNKLYKGERVIWIFKLNMDI